jgi:hypothetical protein
VDLIVYPLECPLLFGACSGAIAEVLRNIRVACWVIRTALAVLRIIAVVSRETMRLVRFVDVSTVNQKS